MIPGTPEYLERISRINEAVERRKVEIAGDPKTKKFMDAWEDAFLTRFDFEIQGWMRAKMSKEKFQQTVQEMKLLERVAEQRYSYHTSLTALGA